MVTSTSAHATLVHNSCSSVYKKTQSCQQMSWQTTCFKQCALRILKILLHNLDPTE